MNLVFKLDILKMIQVNRDTFRKKAVRTIGELEAKFNGEKWKALDFFSFEKRRLSGKANFNWMSRFL